MTPKGGRNPTDLAEQVVQKLADTRLTRVNAPDQLQGKGTSRIGLNRATKLSTNRYAS